MYRLVTSIETRIAFFGTFLFSIKLINLLCGIFEVGFLYLSDRL